MGMPFRGEQIKPDIDDPHGREWLRALSADPHKIIRKTQLYEDPDDRKKQLADHRHAKTYFDRLRDDYGMAIPDIDIVVGDDEDGQKTIFNVVDRIDGRNVEHTRRFSAEDVPEFEAFFVGLFSAYKDDITLERPYWSDFGEGQLVYGRRKGEDKDRVHIVDIQPYMRAYDHRQASDARTFLKELFFIEGQMEHLEEKFPEGTRFEAARAKLEEVRELATSHGG